MRRDRSTFKREPLLDLLRWVAALLVAFSHWVQEIPHLFQQGLPNHLSPLAREGGVGVPIFFVVSGYVISLTAASKASSIKFAYARFVRLFPGLLISMLVVLFVGERFILSYAMPLESFLVSISLTYNVFGVQALTTVLWTLIVEIKFYLAIVILLILDKRMFQRPSWIATFMVLFLILQRTGFLGAYVFLDSQLLGYTKYFLLGTSLYFLSISLRGSLLGTLGFGSISVIYYLQVIGSDSLSISDRMISFSIVLILFSSFVKLPNRFSSVTYALGLASYPIYLVHSHLGIAIINVLGARVENATLVLFGGGIVTLTLVCIGMNIFAEKPLQKLLKRVKFFN